MSVSCVMVDGDREYVVLYDDEPAWRASMDWARFHGLDPMRMPGGVRVERDAANRRILFSEFVKTGPAIDDILIQDGEAVTVDRIEQGEAPPLPFPREVTG